MPSPDPRDWRTSQLQIVQRSERDVIKLLAQVHVDIDHQIGRLNLSGNVSSKVRRSQLLKIKRIVAKQQAKLWQDLGILMRARRLDAAANRIALSVEFDKQLFETLGGFRISNATIDALIKAEEAAAKSALDRMLRRVYGDSFVNLSQRVYRSSVAIGKVLDNRVNSALARGLSAREFAIELRPYIDPQTPGGIRYAAMRLARSEINNAAHAVAVNDMIGKPWIEGGKWVLSASHPKVDICDDLAEGGPNGDGIYPPGEIPGLPHPHCFCQIIPVSMSDSDFLSALAAGRFDAYAVAKGYLKAA